MIIAKGTNSWILTTFIFGILFLLLSIIFKEKISFIFLFLSVLLFLLTGFFIMFFRDPKRRIGKDIVAPADGRIRDIFQFNDCDIGKCIVISTFMNVHNVHVNRMPIDGIIKEIVHKKGSHLPAFKKKSIKNEKVIIIIDTTIGLIKIIQIAGTLARRIVPYIRKGDRLKKGEKIGIIKLGSRVDIFLPIKKIKKINIKLGDTIKAGVVSIAEIND